MLKSSEGTIIFDDYEIETPKMLTGETETVQNITSATKTSLTGSS